LHVEDIPESSILSKKRRATFVMVEFEAQNCRFSLLRNIALIFFFFTHSRERHTKQHYQGHEEADERP
jgi:hypothetical protein